MKKRLSSPQKLKIMSIVSALFALLLVMAAVSVSSQEQIPAQERKLDVKTFKGMPVKIRKVKNLQSKDWPRELEIEVENVSLKPIYYIHIVVEFPDAPAPAPPPGAPAGVKTGIGVTLDYGNPLLGDVKRKLAGPEDIPIKPGEAYVFKLPESLWLGIENMKKNGRIPPGADNKLSIIFTHISFGDGTGYEAGRYKDKKFSASEISKVSKPYLESYCRSSRWLRQ